MDEQRKCAILFVATILAARKLNEIGSRLCPAREGAIADAISNAERRAINLGGWPKWDGSTKPSGKSERKSSRIYSEYRFSENVSKKSKKSFGRAFPVRVRLSRCKEAQIPQLVSNCALCLPTS